jgi:FtsP/CotA-like multicopper oxidase with cupredoxin domain
MTTESPANEGSETRFTRRRLLVVAGSVAAAAGAGGGYGLSRLFNGGRGGEVSAPPRLTLRARADEVELGRRRAATWSYGELPGRELRLRAGEEVRIRVVNDLPEPTSIHWHGIRLANAADGVPGMTQEPIAPGESFDYVFTPPDPGTFIYHSHVGTQLDRGLYGPLIVEPRREELDYDREAVLLFDDWLDGIAGTPDRKLAQLRDQMAMGGMTMGGKKMGGGMSGGSGMGMGTGSRFRHTGLDGMAPPGDHLAALANGLEGGRLDAGDVRYPLYLVNGRLPEAPAAVHVRRGDRVRLRLVNPSSDTIFCVFVEGHPLTIVRADGGPVEPVETDAVLLGMGERYDVLVDLPKSGYARVVGMPLGKRGRAVALLRTADAAGAPPMAGMPLALPRRIASYGDLRDPDGARRANDARTIRLDLGLTRGRYEWTVGGQAFPKAAPVRVRRGERVRFVMRNRTTMPHPMHLHGHDFRPVFGSRLGVRKDTILVAPQRETAVEWLADNPGAWAFHCHNIYHAEAGMMRRVEVA